MDEIFLEGFGEVGLVSGGEVEVQRERTRKKYDMSANGSE